jgi:hypothetical protein
MAVRRNRTFTLDEMSARFENWRQNRQGKAPVPDELWGQRLRLPVKRA